MHGSIYLPLTVSSKASGDTQTQTHTYTSLQRYRRLAASCFTSWLSKLAKNITPRSLEFQLKWRGSHWQPRLQLTKPLPISGTFLKKHILLTCMPTQRAPYVCHVHTFFQSDAHAHTLTFTGKFSNLEILAGRLIWGLSRILKNKLSSPPLLLFIWFYSPLYM